MSLLRGWTSLLSDPIHARDRAPRQTARRARVTVPSSFVLMRLAAVSILLVVITHTTADPDLWGHVRFGQDIVAEQAVPIADSYAFTSDGPWVNHEYLAEVIMFSSYAAAGSAGLIGLKLTLVIGAIALVVCAARRLTLRPIVRDFIVSLAIFGTFPQTTHVRPQLFSIFLFALLLVLLIEADHGRRRALLAVPLLMLLWANLHGGWLVGAGTLGVWVGFGVIDGSRSWRTRGFLAAVGLLSLAATLVNPYGTGMWTFLHETVGVERADIVDWQPIVNVGPAITGLWLLTLAVATYAVIRAPRLPRPSYLVIVATLALATALVNRLLGFFTLSVVILLAPQIAGAWRSRPETHATSSNRSGERASAMLQMAAVAVILVGSALVFQNLRCLRMDAEWFPEPDVFHFVRLNHLEGRMLTWFDWGEYAIWHFAPALTVSMDGRRETVYSAETIANHLRFYFDGPGGRAYARTLDPDYVWLPNVLPVIDGLKEDGWVPIFEGPISILLAKSAEAPVQQPTTASTATRCFPDP